MSFSHCKVMWVEKCDTGSKMLYFHCFFCIIRTHTLCCCVLVYTHYSCWSNHLFASLLLKSSFPTWPWQAGQPTLSVSPQVLLLYCVPLHPRWLHPCHPTCRQWHLPHSDLPPTRHHLQDWGGGCEEGERSRQTEGKSCGELHYWGYVRRAFIYVCMNLTHLLLNTSPNLVWS